ncbi:MAG: zinc metallopeptidase [Fimbriimonadaceae bacterium]|nr:zinc metallopeptidase [Fimbriimonadaceae bacterium]
MRWKGRRESGNIEDRRGARTTAVGGGIGVVVLLLIAWALGGDPVQLLSQLSEGGVQQGQSAPDPAEEPLREFVAVTLADTEQVWNELLPQQAGVAYREPKLVLFTDRVQSACGLAGAAVGPFYCPEDEDVYLDLGFFETLSKRLGAKGDFARAYVVAHEVGHHVQKILGTMERVDAQRRRLSEREANALTVRLELQADFYAGVWAHHARSVAGLDEADIREAIEAAGAIGDDTLQMKARGEVVPDAFTHGTSAQRTRWFLRGWETGRLSEGDTFAARSL